MGKQIVSATPGGAGVKWEDLKGKLLVIEPLNVEKEVPTQHGAADAVRSNVYVVLSKDGSKSEEFEDTLVFPRILQSQIRKNIGSIVVGRLQQGEKTPGKNPPWILAEATAGDLKAAGAFWAAKSMSSASGEDDDVDDYEDDEDAF